MLGGGRQRGELGDQRLAERSRAAAMAPGTIGWTLRRRRVGGPALAVAADPDGRLERAQALEHSRGQPPNNA